MSLFLEAASESVKCILSLPIWNDNNLKYLSLFFSCASVDKRPSSPYFSYSVN